MEEKLVEKIETTECSTVRGTVKPAISEDYSRWDRNERYRKEIVTLLNKDRKPMCVQDVSNIIGCAWVTAKSILADLCLEGKLKFWSYRDGYGRLYMINEEWLNAKAAEKV